MSWLRGIDGSNLRKHGAQSTSRGWAVQWYTVAARAEHSRRTHSLYTFLRSTHAFLHFANPSSIPLISSGDMGSAASPPAARNGSSNLIVASFYTGCQLKSTVRFVRGGAVPTKRARGARS